MVPSPPASLSALSQLRSCGFLSYEDPKIPGDPGQLPAGPWLTGLRRLAGTCTLLAASLPALAAAGQLRDLGLLLAVGSERQAAVSTLQWAASRPAVPRVLLECGRSDSGSVQPAAEAAPLQPAQLTVAVNQPGWWDEYEWGGAFPDLPPVPRRS